jgi:Tol biopolymer transport system component/DNA-binding winged helix-turn-helix (wHTH) protein
VAEAVHSRRLVRFGTYEVDLPAGELKKCGVKLKLSGQPFQVLAILLEQPGTIVTREELQKRLWPDTFVDVDHNLNTAINKIREVLDDSAENPRFVETLPRRGYRFVAQVEGTGAAKTPDELLNRGMAKSATSRGRPLRVPMLIGVCALLAGAGFLIYKRQQISVPKKQHPLARVTFEDGVQIGVTWSPDGRFIAYSSDRGGKFDIWVQQISGGNPVQITKGPGQNWQPDWSPDGKYIAYRSENGNGGLFVVPPLGGEGLERMIASFGYYPLWSPDSSQILFRTHFAGTGGTERFYLVDLDGGTPREVFANSISQGKLEPLSAAWHPDGKRISLMADGPGPIADFWTVPVAGGVAVKSQIAPEVEKQIEEVSTGQGNPLWMDPKFCWAPSGKAIYFGIWFRGARNIWKMNIDPDTLRATALERLTTGSGPDDELGVSADGKRLAFTEETRHTRTWLFPFDATRGRVNGTGQAVTSRGVEAWTPKLSRDGKRLAFSGIRAGKLTVWEKSLMDGHEAPIVADNYIRDYPQWSPDGTRLAYRRFNTSTSQNQIMVWSAQSHTEEPVSKSSSAYMIPYDWSLDAERLLFSLQSSETDRTEVWLLPVGAVNASKEQLAKRIIFDPELDIWQPHFSPDGHWIVFEAVRNSTKKLESALYAVPTSGGPWTRISAGKNWDDKPCWAPDGKTIYFLSNGGGLFSVWGIRFDPGKGKPVGEPFRVTSFENTSLMIPNSSGYVGYVGLSVTQDKLVVTVEELSGGIWVLDNVDR